MAILYTFWPDDVEYDFSGLDLRGPDSSSATTPM